MFDIVLNFPLLENLAAEEQANMIENAFFKEQVILYPSFKGSYSFGSLSMLSNRQKSR